MQKHKKPIFSDFRPSQREVVIGLGASRDKHHFFLSKITQRKVRQKLQNSLESSNERTINKLLIYHEINIICMIF